MDSSCFLCGSSSHNFFEKTYKCSRCFFIFKTEELFLSKEDEEARYRFHQNKENDQGYKDFLNRLVVPLKTFLKKENSFLDYGCGSYSQLSKLVEDHVATTDFYAPLFFPNQNNVTQYDIVACTEVVEHFKNPLENWKKLIKTVKPQGILAVMTQFYDETIDYKTWWYKNDPTHIGFYSEETFEYLAEKFHIKILYNDHRSVIIFRNG